MHTCVFACVSVMGTSMHLCGGLTLRQGLILSLIVHFLQARIPQKKSVTERLFPSGWPVGTHVSIVLKSSVDLIPDNKQLQVQLGLGFEGLLSIMWGKEKQRQEHEKTGWSHACVVKKQMTHP